MSKDTKSKAGRKRGTRGQGQLFKKYKGKQYPASKKVPGTFYLRYVVNGKRVTKALRDEDGNAITNKDDAEDQRDTILAPFAAKDEADALRHIQARLTAAEDTVQAIERDQASIAIADAWEAYLASPRRSKKAGEDTLAQYKIQFDMFASWAAENQIAQMCDVSSKSAAKYAKTLSEKSAGTFNKHIGTLSRVWAALSKEAKLTDNPWAKDEISREEDVQNSRRELTVPELERIISSCTGEMRLLFAIGVYTGLRLKDCATLRWDEIDFRQGKITREPAKTKRRKKPKVVIVPLRSDLRGMLQAVKPPRATGYVLPDTAELYNARPYALTDRIQHHIWAQAIDCHAAGTGEQIVRDKAGEPIRTHNGFIKREHTGVRAVVAVGFHSLRHTFVSLCREADVSMSVVESLVGHSNPAMTRHYTHTSEREARRAVDCLPSITGEQSTPQDEPLPPWAVELIKGATGRNWKKVQAELLERGAV